MSILVCLVGELELCLGLRSCEGDRGGLRWAFPHQAPLGVRQAESVQDPLPAGNTQDSSSTADQILSPVAKETKPTSPDLAAIRVAPASRLPVVVAVAASSQSWPLRPEPVLPTGRP